MNIAILQLLEGAKNARGLAVVIDVFRAFSTACYAFYNGIERIYPVTEVKTALITRAANPEIILIGEQNEQKPQGFDFGNSPSHIKDCDLTGKIMIHRTSSGTQGILNATRADEIITGSFVNASAIVRYIRQLKHETISLVCMGYACEYPTDEDTLCAEYIKNELEGKQSDFEKMKKTIRVGSGARFFISESQDWAPSTDFDLCLSLNRFNFVLKAEKEGGNFYLRRVDI